jgi:serine/threonine protein phosphatase 1
MDEPRLLAFGDLHGAIRPLRRLLKRLNLRSTDRLVFLGDYIDRGENSRAVLDLLFGLAQDFKCVFLKGNHEDMFLRSYFGEDEDWYLWQVNGGHTTWRDFAYAWPPEPYLTWMQSLETLYETETHYFVHAGLLPGLPPEQTPEHERLWIREPFLSSTFEWGKPVVFGHTIQLGGPLVQANKLGIDTGAFLPAPMGKLTCLVLPEGRFVASRGRDRLLTNQARSS